MPGAPRHVPGGGPAGPSRRSPRRRARAGGRRTGGRRSSRCARRCRARSRGSRRRVRGRAPSTVNGTTPIVVAGSFGPMDADARGCRPAQSSRRRSRPCSCSTMRSQPSSVEPRGRRREGDGAEQVGRAGLLPVGQVGPHDLVERDGVDRAAATMVGRAAEAVSAPDERAATERGVQLVRRQRDEVEVLGVAVGPHVDRPVRGELGGVDEDPPAGGVHPPGQVVDRRDDAGDIRCARHDEQRDPAGVTGEDGGRGRRDRASRRPGTDVDRGRPAPATADRWSGAPARS